MQINKPHTFVNEWNFNKMSFMVDLRIDVWTKEMLNITPCQKCCFIKVRKRAKIRNLYNQAPHLTQDTNGKVKTTQFDITNESQEVSSFPAGDHKASINRRIRKHSKNKTEITQMILKSSTALFSLT